ncbi:hypothetical protein FRC09_009201 [Ceratobasidium sp. 395]|nr:hypothetical protein FRC09_009201 [Ceratobasidium sp. 395]
MSAPTYIVQSGDVLLIPENKLTKVTIEWQQMFQDKKADYYAGFVPVKGKSEADQVLVFIQSEWYPEAANLAKIATKGKLVPPISSTKRKLTVRATRSAVGDRYELKVDGKSRYGQKNAKGEARFIVQHDTSRNPYQHRFMNQVLRQTALGIGQKVAQMLGVAGGVTSLALSQVQALVGDELRKF